MPDTYVAAITVTCECGEVIFEGTDTIEEKYPFWCDNCEDYKRTGKYPWTLKTRIMPKQAAPEHTTSPPSS